eukprot:gene30769-35808_t
MSAKRRGPAGVSSCPDLSENVHGRAALKSGLRTVIDELRAIPKTVCATSEAQGRPPEKDATLLLAPILAKRIGATAHNGSSSTSSRSSPIEKNFQEGDKLGKVLKVADGASASSPSKSKPSHSHNFEVAKAQVQRDLYVTALAKKLQADHSNPEAEEKVCLIHRALDLVDECLESTMEDFKLTVTDIVDSIEEDRSEIDDSQVKALFTRLLFILSRCSRLLITEQSNLKLRDIAWKLKGDRDSANSTASSSQRESSGDKDSTSILTRPTPPRSSKLSNSHSEPSKPPRHVRIADPSSGELHPLPYVETETDQFNSDYQDEFRSSPEDSLQDSFQALPEKGSKKGSKSFLKKITTNLKSTLDKLKSKVRLSSTEKGVSRDTSFATTLNSMISSTGLGGSAKQSNPSSSLTSAPQTSAPRTSKTGAKRQVRFESNSPKATSKREVQSAKCALKATAPRRPPNARQGQAIHPTTQPKHSTLTLTIPPTPPGAKRQVRFESNSPKATSKREASPGHQNLSVSSTRKSIEDLATLRTLNREGSIQRRRLRKGTPDDAPLLPLAQYSLAADASSLMPSYDGEYNLAADASSLIQGGPQLSIALLRWRVEAHWTKSLDKR